MQPTSNKKQITDALKWTEQEYADFQYESGLAYLEKYIPDDKNGVNMLSRSRIFWRWWINHWNQRDLQFILSFKKYIGFYTSSEEFYKSIHDVEVLIDEIFPNAAVLSESYAVMIDDFHHEKTEA